MEKGLTLIPSQARISSNLRGDVMFNEPTDGSRVTITTDWSDVWKPGIAAINVRNKFKTTGVKVKSAKHDNPGTWRILTMQPFGPGFRPFESVIESSRVIDVEYHTGSAGANTHVNNDNKLWRVKGSKGDNYLVQRIDGKYTCDCQGFAFRRQCKHIGKVGEFIKRQATKSV